MALILVIDDDGDVLPLVQQTLVGAGHYVLEASDGEVGLRRVSRIKCDLVITDTFMPDMDGIVPLRRLRKERPEIKVIVMSGGDATEELDFRQDAEFLGAAMTLKKPFRPAELVQVVQDLLEQGPRKRPGSRKPSSNPV